MAAVDTVQELALDISSDAPADEAVAPAKPAAKPAGKPAGKAGSYDADAIEVLEGLEAVRRRPGMYIGDNGPAGLAHLLWEVVDNAVDEAAAGHGKLIEIVLHADGSCEVADRGRGIPVDVHNGDKTALEVVFTQLHAGAKFGSGHYSASGGLHGVGAAVVNAYSTRLVVDVNRNAKTHRLEFRDRKPGNVGSGGRFRPGHALAKVGTVGRTRTGTRVRFWPETDLFEPGAALDYDEVRERVAQLCFLLPGLRIRLHDKRRGRARPAEELLSAGGLRDFVESLSAGSKPVTALIALSGSEEFEEAVAVDGRPRPVVRECRVDVVMRWVAGYAGTLVSFVNTIPTPDGGTHVAGFERAVTAAVNGALRDADPVKLRRLRGDVRAQREDAQEGLIAVLRVTLPEPQFRGQTKRELTTTHVQRIVSGVVRTGLREWFDGTAKGSRKAHVKAVLDKIGDAMLGRAAARRAQDEHRTAASLGSTGLPDKLSDCREHPRGELLIVEGDSAAGPAKRARDAAWQAVLPLRGKVVNAAKSTRQAVLENAEAAALFTAVGAGSGAEFDLARARYERVVLLADADVDGSHIRCLVLTLAFHYMRPLLDAGRVYAAQPPTHAVVAGQAKEFVYSDDELAARTAELDAAGRSYRVTRFKGLGEMDDDELYETTLNPATRVLRQVTIDEAAAAQAQAEKAFGVMMGADVEPRKKFIVEHSKAYGHALDV
ncbi:MAG TPA: DNA topoisomerase IV subunit B [Acidimicrobiaceae bacterium]|nr:DNA topoisomerase IV subunit B [Acidimicrobiaceae bacterium]HCB37763.1 DNA topoisomerase IV subunit B [Acidimicrobiaceae bacterium]